MSLFWSFSFSKYSRIPTSWPLRGDFEYFRPSFRCFVKDSRPYIRFKRTWTRSHIRRIIFPNVGIIFKDLLSFWFCHYFWLIGIALTVKFNIHVSIQIIVAVRNSIIMQINLSFPVRVFTWNIIFNIFDWYRRHVYYPSLLCFLFWFFFFDLWIFMA